MNDSRKKSAPDFDKKLFARREALGALGAIAPLFFIGCGSSTSAGLADADSGASGDDADSGATTTTTTTTSGDSGATTASGDGGDCVEIPTETGGPYPDIDGMISNVTYKRSDITEGKTGTPLTLSLQVLDVANGCAPIVGARVIIWHCDSNGVYSEYASTMNSAPAQGESGSTTTTYLRGWQETDATGTVKFTTIYPGWYTPRVTHIHVMVYNPTNLTTPVKTTQFCFPDSVNNTVYAQAKLYPKGAISTTDASDMVFGASDEDERLVAAITGSTASGYVASLPIGVASY